MKYACKYKICIAKQLQKMAIASRKMVYGHFEFFLCSYITFFQ